MDNEIQIRHVEKNDIDELVQLINLAYRTEGGWTTEFGMVDGQRISKAQLIQALSSAHFELYVLEVNATLLGCIGLTQIKDSVEIGSFAIHPSHQNKGYGRQLLSYAERVISAKQQINKIVMLVLNLRTELLAYYQRCGYSETGEREAYPCDANVGKPLHELDLIVLQKLI